VELTRGGIVECIHFGAFAVVDSSGNLLASAGDPNLKTFPRSSMKPFQALPFVESGGPEHFGFTEEELAIIVPHMLAPISTLLCSKAFTKK